MNERYQSFAFSTLSMLPHDSILLVLLREKLEEGLGKYLVSSEGWEIGQRADSGENGAVQYRGIYE